MNDSAAYFSRLSNLLESIERLLPPGTPEQVPDAATLIWQRFGERARFREVTPRNMPVLEHLQCIDDQKNAIERNTRQFINGLPCNHALLWGPRGTGKSSLIKAIFDRFQASGLRLVEIHSDQVMDLPLISELLAGQKHRYLIYCDDLSFDSNDISHKAMKVALDGTIGAPPDNILIYATSNRRHLLPEYIADNLNSTYEDGELHLSDAVEERISLSERFGLWLSFHPFSQQEYLHIVECWLHHFEPTLQIGQDVQNEALQWALQHGSRSGRSAWQFACDFTGRMRLNS